MGCDKSVLSTQNLGTLCSLQPNRGFLLTSATSSGSTSEPQSSNRVMPACKTAPSFYTKVIKHKLTAQPKGSALPPDSWSSRNGYYLSPAPNLQELFNIDTEMPHLSDLSSRCLKCHLCLLSASPIWSFLSIYGEKKLKWSTLPLSGLISPGCQYPPQSFSGDYFTLLSVPARGSGSFGSLELESWD